MGWRHKGRSTYSFQKLAIKQNGSVLGWSFKNFKELNDYTKSKNPFAETHLIVSTIGWAKKIFEG